MAGTNAGFDADAFRTGIRLAMTMGGAPVTDEQVVWHFPAALVYVGDVDAEGVPFDPASTVARIEPAPVKVPCAVDYDDAEAVPTAFGLLAPSRVKITVLDQDYATIKDAVYVVIAGDRYNLRRVQPPSGLFDVGLYVLHFSAEQET